MVRAGTEQALLRASRRGARAGARASPPADGTIIALDPDIPPAAQRVASRRERAWRHRRQAARRGPASRLPWPGRHRLELVDASGQTLQSVAFEVRGAGVRSPREAPR